MKPLLELKDSRYSRRLVIEINRTIKTKAVYGKDFNGNHRIKSAHLTINPQNAGKIVCNCMDNYCRSFGPEDFSDGVNAICASREAPRTKKAKEN